MECCKLAGMMDREQSHFDHYAVLSSRDHPALSGTIAKGIGTVGINFDEGVPRAVLAHPKGRDLVDACDVSPESPGSIFQKREAQRSLPSLTHQKRATPT